MGLMHMSRKMSRLKVRMKKIPLIAGTKGRRHKQHRLSSALCRRVIDVLNDEMLGRGSRQVRESHHFCSMVEDFDLFSCSLGFYITIHGVNDLRTWYRVTGGMCREGRRQGQDETRRRSHGLRKRSICKHAGALRTAECPLYTRTTKPVRKRG